jgi:hypothetical protein
VRAGFENACRAFTERISACGFSRGKKRLWHRSRQFTAEFIYFHRHGSTYGAPINAEVDIRVHFGIRAFNDPFGGLALNGPESAPWVERAGRYHLRFNAKSGSMFDRCIDIYFALFRTMVNPGFANSLTSKRYSTTKVRFLKSRKRRCATTWAPQRMNDAFSCHTNCLV